MTVERWQVGEIRITRIEEQSGWTPLELVLQILPAATRKEVEAVEWLAPTYLRDGQMNTLVNSFLLETPTATLVVDTGVGNDKPRLASLFDHLETDFLERLARVRPVEQIDGVLCTHLHVDHVGWNTVWRDGQWMPTFPQATYHFVREEYEHWKSFAQDPMARSAYSEVGYRLVDATAVFEDSLRPIEEAGLIGWVQPGQEVVPGVTLLSTAGHTPGHVAVLVESAGESAVITGDLLHTPVQIARPDWSAQMDTDGEAAARTRREFVERFADTPTLVIGTHFGGPAAGHIITDSSSHRLVPVPG